MWWADFHVHTRWSRDSLASPKQVVRAAIRRGLDAIAVTDHNEVAGALEVEEEARRAGVSLKVIHGEEVKTDQGDVIGLFISERIPGGIGLLEAVDRIREQGGLVVIPHPFDRRARGALGQAVLEVMERIDYIEVINGRTPPWNNRKAWEFADRHGIAGLGGSDAHWPAEVGKVRTLVDGLENGRIRPVKVVGGIWPPMLMGMTYSSIAKLLRILQP